VPRVPLHIVSDIAAIENFIDGWNDAATH